MVKDQPRKLFHGTSFQCDIYPYIGTSTAMRHELVIKTVYLLTNIYATFFFPE
jgi:hypothetical protein